jgi:hypothetical protein
MHRLGLIFALLGLAMVAAAALVSGTKAMRYDPDCPKLRTVGVGAPPLPMAYLTGREVRLGAPVCLALDRSRVFAREQAALASAELEADSAQKALAAAGAAAPAGSAPATASAAQARVVQAKAALDALPRERKVFLYFDDVRVPMQGKSIAVKAAAGESEWVLEEIALHGTEEAASDDGKSWREILGGPKGGGVRDIRIGVAVEEAADAAPVMRALIAERARLRVFEPLWVLAGGLGLVLATVGIGMRGWHTGLLRDGGPGSAFSLARVQMAWWLVLTVGGFLFIWLVSGQWRDVITGGVIALLGISATTGVAAVMVDRSPDKAGAVAVPLATRNFWSDILGDADGAALHRIQLIAWTVLLGGIFVWTVIWSFAFPDFDTNLLLLAGLAGGTYLGFKFQES